DRLLPRRRDLRHPEDPPPEDTLYHGPDPHLDGGAGVSALPTSRGNPSSSGPQQPSPARSTRRALSGSDLWTRPGILARLRADPRVAAQRLQHLHPRAALVVDRDRLHPDLRPDPARNLFLWEGLL